MKSTVSAPLDRYAHHIDAKDITAFVGLVLVACGLWILFDIYGIAVLMVVLGTVLMAVGAKTTKARSR